MNKYVLPLIILVGLIIIISYSSFGKPQKTTPETTSTLTTTVTQVQNSPASSSQSALLATDEEKVIGKFFKLINDKKTAEAISMMTSEMAGDESTKQAWRIHLNSIDSVILKKINLSIENGYTSSRQEYKVILDVKMSSKSASAVIPYYGWENGENIRWVIIKKEGDIWKISELATGP